MKRENCPCCGYPTLKKRCYDEICMLCDWEDWGYSELDPEIIDGGPNGDYSLEEAKQNFETHLTMYRKIPKNTSPAFVEKKRRLIKAYETLHEINEEYESVKWDQILKLEKDLLLNG